MSTTAKVASLYCDVHDLAAQLGVSVATIYRWRSEKRDMPRGFKVGQGVRWTQDAIDSWIQQQMQKEAS